MGGNSGGNNSGDRDTYNPVTGKQYSKPRKNPVAEFVKGGGVTGAVIRGIKKQADKSKKKKQANVEVGLGKDRMSNYSVGQGGTASERDNDNNNPPPIMTTGTQTVGSPVKKTIPETNKKSSEQPKVKSQMNNKDVKSSLIVADKTAPTGTSTEASAEEILLKNKRKGRKKTVLTSVTGVEGYPTLSRRTLLG